VYIGGNNNKMGSIEGEFQQNIFVKVLRLLTTKI